MFGLVANLVEVVRANLARWAALTLAMTTLYYAVLVLAPMVKFRQWPNYAHAYDWFANVRLIVASTPSWRDIAMIVKEEWVLEIGFMNYDFGIGLSQWSVFFAPAKILGVVLLSALLATLIVLLQAAPSCAHRGFTRSTKLAGGVGAGFAALASVTLSWVVCCSTPTWVVGLAMMGLGVSTALWLEPLGPWLSLLGFGLLITAVLMAAANSRSPQSQILVGTHAAQVGAAKIGNASC